MKVRDFPRETRPRVIRLLMRARRLNPGKTSSLLTLSRQQWKRRMAGREVFGNLVNSRKLMCRTDASSW